VHFPLRNVRLAQHRIDRHAVGGLELVSDREVPDGADTPARTQGAGQGFPDLDQTLC
jgi:hypothetical protein